jgi:hypothetical protein
VFALLDHMLRRLAKRSRNSLRRLKTVIIGLDIGGRSVFLEVSESLNSPCLLYLRNLSYARYGIVLRVSE